MYVGTYPTLTFQTANEPLEMQLKEVNLLQPDGVLIGCELHGQINPEQHDRIESENLFTLQPEFRTLFSNGEFRRDRPIYTVLLLDPEHLEALESFNQAETVVEFLLEEPITSPLRHADNWMLLWTSQQHPEGTTGYRTLWNYLDRVTLAESEAPEEELVEGMTRFMAESTLTQNLAEALNLPKRGAIATTQNLSYALLQSIPGLLRQDEESTERLSGAIARVFESALNEELDNLSETLTEVIEDSEEVADELDEWLTVSSDTPLFDCVIAFFESENWPFEQVEGELMVRSLFESEVGTWLCLAEVREDTNQFIFYAIGNRTIPQSKRPNLAELFMRLNYSELTLGNFELDFEDGEFRYRTGVDCTGIQPDMSLIQTAIERSMSTLEQYLPMILAALSL